MNIIADTASQLVTVFEDANLLVVNKPAGLACHPSKTGPESSLIGRLRLYLGPDVRPHLVNRLDRETSGLVLVAKQPATARELGRAWEARQVRKEYLAIVHGHLAADHGLIDAPLGKDTASPVAIKDCVLPDGMPAQTEFRVEQAFERAEGSFSLLKVVPRTGRKHQIRIHLAYLGHPLVGDKIYGGDATLYLAFIRGALTLEQWRRLLLPNHALHAARLEFELHGKPFSFHADPDAQFRAFASV